MLLKLHVHYFKYISSKILLFGRDIIFSGTKKENNNENNTQDMNSDRRHWRKARQSQDR